MILIEGDGPGLSVSTRASTKVAWDRPRKLVEFGLLSRPDLLEIGDQGAAAIEGVNYAIQFGNESGSGSETQQGKIVRFEGRYERDTGLAIGVGFGVDVPLTPAFSLRPEFRTYSSVAMSRVNLGMHRGAIGVRYRW